MDDGFPNLTDSYLLGQDIFYGQFNSINFYVEDTGQEHFYFNILKKLFVDIKFEKIFPLNGKCPVIREARDNLGDKSKVYIVDLDFDEILGTKEEHENLFYLERYSIENYLVEKCALYEIIREKKPALKDVNISCMFDYAGQIKCCKNLLIDLSISFLIIQKYSINKEYYKLTLPRDVDLSSSPPKFRNKYILEYFDEVESLLKNIDRRFTFKAQSRRLRQNFQSIEKALTNIPGKYILKLLKYQLESLKLISQMEYNSFSYKLSKECSVNELQYLKINIEKYIG